MEKYSKISNDQKGELIQEFSESISVLNNPDEIMCFLVDLLTKQEILMIAKRIKIAKMLINQESYQNIGDVVKVSSGTIAKINQWLLDSGDGFRLVSSRTKKSRPMKKINDYQFNDIKRAYPIMFWPELLIRDIVKTMNKKQKEKLNNVLKKMDQKSNLYKDFKKFL